MSDGEGASTWDADRHLQLLVTLHWVIAGIFGLGFLFASYAIGPDFLFLPFAILPVVALHAAAAMGLTQREHWGRIISIIAAALSLFSFPFGTAFGVYAIVVHTRSDVKEQLQGGTA